MSFRFGFSRRRSRGLIGWLVEYAASVLFANNDIYAPTIGAGCTVSRDGVMSYTTSDGGIEIISEADTLTPDKRISGGFSNLLARPYQFSEWTDADGANASTVIPNSVDSAQDGHKADKITFAAAATSGRTYTFTAENAPNTFSILVKGVSGGETITIDIDGTTQNHTCAATPAWEWVNVTATPDAGTKTVKILNQTAAAKSIYIDRAQVCKSSFRLPFVAGVDADKMAGGGVNLASGWTPTNCSVATGQNGAHVRVGVPTDRITASDNGATIDDDTTWTAAPDTHYEANAIVDKKTAAQTAWISMTDGTNYCRGVVDLVAGTADTPTGSGWNAIRCDVYDAGNWWWVRLVGRPTAVRANTKVRITLPVSGDVLDIDAVWCPGRTGPIPQTEPVGTPIATYYFDPADGHDDGTGNGHDGTPSGVTVLDDGTLVLNGSGSVALDANLGLTASDDLFVTFLFNTSHDYTGSYGHIISDYNKDTPKGWYVGFTFDNRIYVINLTSVGNQRWVRTAPGAYNDGYWHTGYAYVKKDGTDNDLRIDDINQTNEGVDGTSPTAINMGSANVTIGRQSNPDERYFVGQIREIAVYTALSDAERQEIQARAFPTSETASYYTLSPLTFSESVAGSREAYTCPDTNVTGTISSATGENLIIGAVAKFDAAMTSQRETTSRIISVQDLSAADTDYAYIGVDSSGDRVVFAYQQTGDGGETLISLNTASLKTAIASGEKLFFAARHGRLYIQSFADGTEWTTGDDTGVALATSNIDNFSVGSKNDNGLFSEHVDARYYGHIVAPCSFVPSLHDFRELAHEMRRRCIASNE